MKQKAMKDLSSTVNFSPKQTSHWFDIHACTIIISWLQVFHILDSHVPVFISELLGGEIPP